MENTSPVPQSRVFFCGTGVNQNWESMKNCLLKWSNSSSTHCKSNTWQHVWQEVSPDVLYLICEEKWVSQYIRRYTLQLTRKVSNKRREKALFHLQYPNAPNLGWRQSGKDSACSRIKVFNPLAFTNSLKTSMKVKLEREFLTVSVHPLLLDTERLHLWQPLWVVKQHQEADMCFWG